MEAARPHRAAFCQWLFDTPFPFLPAAPNKLSSVPTLHQGMTDCQHLTFLI